MIDPDLLRQLGWKDDLIAAVTRVAEPMRTAADGITNAGTPPLTTHCVAGNAIYADQITNSSSQGIIANSRTKK